MQISIVMSAIRPKHWGRLMKSLESNKCSYEVIFVGPVPPYIKDGGKAHLRWIESKVKPTECYEIGFRASKGELVGWSADDVVYHMGALDKIWHSREPKAVLAMELYEDYGAGFNNNTMGQKLGIWPRSPLMAPFGFMEREWLKRLGGCDRNFVTGQYENDIVMRALEDGGKVKVVTNSMVWVHHKECHGGVEGTNFSKEGFKIGRAHLEKCWVRYGMVSKKRLIPFEPFTESECGKW